MKKNIKETARTIIIAIAVILGTSYVMAWTAPTQTPPAGNVVLSFVPAGAVMAFNLSGCPTGWVLANGTGGTADLRGVFVRGLDKGAGKDIDGASRALASYQADEFASHAHQAYAPTSGGPANLANPGHGIGNIYQNTTSVGGNETRPKNVALLYCQKQ